MKIECSHATCDYGDLIPPEMAVGVYEGTCVPGGTVPHGGVCKWQQYGSNCECASAHCVKGQWIPLRPLCPEQGCSFDDLQIPTDAVTITPGCQQPNRGIPAGHHCVYEKPGHQCTRSACTETCTAGGHTGVWLSPIVDCLPDGHFSSAKSEDGISADGSDDLAWLLPVLCGLCLCCCFVGAVMWYRNRDDSTKPLAKQDGAVAAMQEFDEEVAEEDAAAGGSAKFSHSGSHGMASAHDSTGA